MPRRLIIGLLVVLIVGIVGGTVALILQRLRSDVEPTPTITPGTLRPADSGSQQVANPAGDDDGDGLSNADERLWGSDPRNSDTDGDGFKDGEEVASRHNPTIAGPNDVLPTGFEPGQNIQPLTEAPLQIDQLFADNLDLTGGNRNLTEAYKTQIKESDRSPATMNAYIQQQPIITKLPTVRDDAIVVSPNTSSFATTNYVATAGDLSTLANKEALQYGIDQLFQNNDPSLIRGMAAQVRAYQAALRAQQTPANAVATQKVLLGYTELLAATFDQLALFPQDPVKALVALRQLEAIDTQYYPLIFQQMNQLSSL